MDTIPQKEAFYFKRVSQKLNQLWDTEYLQFRRTGKGPSDLVRDEYGGKLDFSNPDRTVDEVVEDYFEHNPTGRLSILSPKDGKLHSLTYDAILNTPFHLEEEPIEPPKKPSMGNRVQNYFDHKPGIQHWDAYERATEDRNSIEAFGQSILQAHRSRKDDPEYQSYLRRNEEGKKLFCEHGAISELAAQIEGNQRTVAGVKRASSPEYEAVLNAMKAIQQQQEQMEQKRAQGRHASAADYEAMRNAYTHLGTVSETYLSSRNPRTAQGRERYQMIQQAKALADKQAQELRERVETIHRPGQMQMFQQAKTLSQMESRMNRRLSDILQEPFTHTDKNGVTRKLAGRTNNAEAGTLGINDLFRSAEFIRKPFEEMRRNSEVIFKMYCLTKGVSEEQLLSLTEEKKEPAPELMEKLRGLKADFMDMSLNRDMDKVANMYVDISLMMEQDGPRFQKLATDHVAAMREDRPLMLKYGSGQGWYAQNIFNQTELSPEQTELVSAVNEKLAQKGKQFTLQNLAVPILAVNSLGKYNESLDNMSAEEIPVSVYQSKLYDTLLLQDGFSRSVPGQSWLCTQSEYIKEYNPAYISKMTAMEDPEKFCQMLDDSRRSANAMPQPKLPAQKTIAPMQPTREDIVTITTQAMRNHLGKMPDGTRKELLRESTEARTRMLNLMKKGDGEPYPGLSRDLKILTLNRLAEEDRLPDYRNKQEALNAVDFGEGMKRLQSVISNAANDKNRDARQSVNTMVQNVLLGKTLDTLAAKCRMEPPAPRPVPQKGAASLSHSEEAVK